MPLTALRMPVELKESMHKAALLQGLTTSEFIRIAIVQAIKKPNINNVEL